MKKNEKVVKWSIMGMLSLEDLTFIRIPDAPVNVQYLEFKARLERYSDEELVKKFNNEVGNRGWVGARANYLAALQDELIERRIDFSEVGNQEELLLTKRVTLVGKKLVPVNDFGKKRVRVESKSV